MKYYVFEVSQGDEKIAGISCAEFDNLTAALASCHRRMATAMSSILYSANLCMVIREDGFVAKREVFVREDIQEESEQPEQEQED